MDEFGCTGFNTNRFLKYFGGINKGRPNAEDLKKRESLQKINSNYKEMRRKTKLTKHDSTENWFSRGKTETDKDIPRNERIAGIGFLASNKEAGQLFLN